MYHTIIIVGNVGRDPEMRYTPAGQAVTSFSVATNRNYTNSAGGAGKGNHLVPRIRLGQTGRDLQPVPAQGQQGAHRRAPDPRPQHRRTAHLEPHGWHPECLVRDLCFHRPLPHQQVRGRRHSPCGRSAGSWRRRRHPVLNGNGPPARATPRAAALPAIGSGAGPPARLCQFGAHLAFSG